MFMVDQYTHHPHGHPTLTQRTHTTRIDTHWWLPLQFLHTTPDDGHAPCPKNVERK